MTEERTRDWLGLRGRTAVVTGAAGGIGAAIALELAGHGMHTAVLDIHADGAEAVAAQAREGGAEAIGVRIDTRDPDSVAAAAAAVTDRIGDVDVLVNNAGIIRAGDLATISRASWQEVLDVNLTGYLLCAQVFGEGMRSRRRGSIIHVSSICGSSPLPSSGAYSPSKAAVSMLARSLALEWGTYGVRSNSLSPGMIRTPLSEHIYATPGLTEARSALVPAQRIGTPEDIAHAAAWLASDRSGYITGQNITIDGGLGVTTMSHIPGPDELG